MAKFNLNKWMASSESERHAKIANGIFSAVQDKKDDFGAMQDAVGLGIPLQAAQGLFHAFVGRYAPLMCVFCQQRFRPRSLYDGSRRSCYDCGKSGKSLVVITPEARKKSIARATANMAVKRGKLKRQPCSVCGEKIAEKHHHDYSKPLDVTWLCRACHMEEHRKESAA